MALVANQDEAGNGSRMTVLDRYSHEYGETNIHNAHTVIMGNVIQYAEPRSSASRTFDKKRFDQLHESLLFERFEFRVSNVKRPLLHTGQWLFDHPAYKTWETGLDEKNEDCSGFLWIKGKPGTGKSTLMKAAFERSRKSASNRDRTHKVIPYFFNARAPASLEKSSLGLYRVLAYHLLTVNKVSQKEFLERFSTKKTSENGVEWTSGELQDFITDSMESELQWKLSLFIDALDEAEHKDDVRDMIDFLMDLTDNTASGACKLRICLSSRHFPYIKVTRGACIVVEDQSAHSIDICTYVNRRLTCGEDGERNAIAETILNKSAGVFLWVTLVVHILNGLDNKGSSFDTLQDQLNVVPAGLDSLFGNVLKHEQREAASGICLQIIMFAERPLTPKELFLAVNHCQRVTVTHVPSEERLSRYIIHHSLGFAEFVHADSDKPPVIQFIHETVREFLISDAGLPSLQPSHNLSVEALSHDMLAAGCANYISTCSIPGAYKTLFDSTTKRTSSTMTSARADVLDHFPFIHYATRHMFDHAAQAHRLGISQNEFLGNQLDGHGKWKKPFCHWTDFIHWPKEHNMEGSLMLILTRRPEYLDLADELCKFAEISATINIVYWRIGPALLEAVRHKSLSLVQSLRRLGADPFQRNADCSPLSEAVALSLHDIISVLIFGTVHASCPGLFNISSSSLVSGSLIYDTDLLLAFLEILQQNTMYDLRIPFLEAMRENDMTAASRLIEMGVGREGKDRLAGLPGTILHSLAASSVTERLHAHRLKSAMQFLLDVGVDVNEANANKETPLAVACRTETHTMVSLLLELGANFKDQKTAQYFLLACRDSRAELVKLLIDAGCEVTAGHDKSLQWNQVPLTIAVAYGHRDTTSHLITAGANVNAEQNGITALILAIRLQHFELVQDLINAGADVNQKSHRAYSPIPALWTFHTIYGEQHDIHLFSNSSPLQSARQIGRDDIERLLLEAGAVWQGDRDNPT